MRRLHLIALLLLLVAPAHFAAEAPKAWSLIAPKEPSLPTVGNAAWPKQDLDRFVLAKLEASGLQPAASAEPSVLVRRLFLDLIGMPPSPSQMKQALAESYEAVVERLLASQAYGERWARHWLDVVRYAESNGRESNLAYPHAWRYRDYVIEAIREDVPYDRFLYEQIAGDLLPTKTAPERARLLIATGFLAFGAKGLNEMNKAQFEADVVDEQLDAVCRSTMASSIACARCHDHKTDPFSMEDYYAMVGIFKSTKTHCGTWIDSENNNGSTLLTLPSIPGQLIPNRSLAPQEVAKLRADLAKLNAEDKTQQEYMAKAAAEGRDLSGEFYELLRNTLRIYWSRGGLEGKLQTVNDMGIALPLCMGTQEAAAMVESPLYSRGEITQPGAMIRRGFPKAFQHRPNIPAGNSSRLELVQWLTHPSHPLTARVMVNRIWRHLFGTGLVRTVDDFGTTGEAPSHPELLDHLALRFMKAGWSVKSMIKEMVLSATYRQRAGEQPSDPDNRLLSHYSRRRLEAEVIRDSMLSVSGLLDTKPRPGSLVATLDGQSVSLMAFNPKLPSDLDGSRHRSIYLPVVRDHLPDVLEQFDLANPSLVTGDRSTTNVPTQALYLLNGPFVQEQAKAMAQRLMEHSAEGSEQIDMAFQLAFCRKPTSHETTLVQQFFEASSASGVDALSAFCQSLLASAEFRLIE